jgi:uncharacterized protein (DUF4415 family)
MKSKRKFLRNTVAEEAAIKAGIAADPDTHEMTDEEAKQLRPFRRGRPPSDTHKVPVTVRLDPEVVEFFREAGQGWQTRLNSALVDYVARRRKVANKAR